MLLTILHCLLLLHLQWRLANALPSAQCPDEHKYGPGPPTDCTGPSDPNSLPASPLEKWFSREMFADLFPYANLGWGPHRLIISWKTEKATLFQMRTVFLRGFRHCRTLFSPFWSRESHGEWPQLCGEHTKGCGRFLGTCHPRNGTQ